MERDAPPEPPPSPPPRRRRRPRDRLERARYPRTSPRERPKRRGEHRAESVLLRVASGVGSDRATTLGLMEAHVDATYTQEIGAVRLIRGRPGLSTVGLSTGQATGPSARCPGPSSST